MAITRDDFKNVPTSGIIPDDRVPASAFAVSYQFEYSGTPSLETFDHSFSGKIILHVLHSSDAVKYVIEIEESYNLFIFPLAPGLALYTWNWVPTSERIAGRKGVAPDAPPMQTLGLATFGVEPAEGSGTTNSEVIVSSRFYSGIFKEPLAGGDKIKIVFHNLSAGFTVARASLSIATEKLSRMVDAAFGLFGELVVARGIKGGGDVQGGLSVSPHAFYDGRGWIQNASDPSLLILPDGRELLGVLQTDGYWEYESLNGQRSWKKLEYPGEGPGDKVSIPLCDGNVQMPQLIRLQNNLRLLLFVSNGRIVARRASDAGVGELIDVGPATGSASYSFDVDGAGVVYIVGEAGTALYSSANDGARFSPIEQSALV